MPTESRRCYTHLLAKDGGLKRLIRVRWYRFRAEARSTGGNVRNKTPYALSEAIIVLRTCLLASLCFFSPLVTGYEVDTHAAISQRAAEVSSLANTLTQLGLMPLAIDDSRQAFPNSEGGIPHSILELIEFGAKW